MTRKRFTAYVIFMGSEGRPFWRIFTRRGWRHCAVIVPAYYPDYSLGSDVFSMLINPLSTHVEIDLFTTHPEAFCLKTLEEGATMAIKVPVDHNPKRDYVPRGFLTCVSLVKAVLGLRAFSIITPEQLARRLILNGGQILEKPQNGKPLRNSTARPRHVA